MTSITSRKLPVPWSEVNKKAKHGHLVPNVVGQDLATFLNLESFSTECTGMLAYVGGDIGPVEIEAKIKKKYKGFVLSPEQRSILESYLTDLQRFKIGNVVEIVPGENGMPRLLLVREYALSAQRNKLP